jgi:hypothetical protein
MTCVNLPVLAKFVLDGKIEPKFPHHKSSYFEIWDFEVVRDVELLVKFYDCDKHAAFLEWQKASHFCHFFFGVEMNDFNSCIFVKVETETGSWISLGDIFPILKRTKIGVKRNDILRVTHVPFSMVWPSEFRKPSPKRFWQFTGEFANVILSEDKTFNAGSHPDNLTQKLSIDLKELATLQKEMFSDEEDRQHAKMIKRNMRARMKIRNTPRWDDIYSLEESDEPTTVSVYQNNVRINRFINGSGQSMFIGNFTINTLCTELDDEVMVISGNQIDKKTGLRYFVCTFLNQTTRNPYSKNVYDSITNIYWLMIIDMYCRFINIERPPNVSRILYVTENSPPENSDPKMETEYPEVKEPEGLEMQITLEDLQTFIEELDFESFLVPVDIEMLNNLDFWQWVLKNLGSCLELNKFEISVRIASVIRFFLMKRLLKVPRRLD